MIVRYKILVLAFSFFLIHGEARVVLGISRMDLRNHSLQSMCVYPDGREDKINCFVPCKGIQDILGLWTLGRGFRITGTDFTFRTSETGFFELNSGFQNAGFLIHKQKFSGLRNPTYHLHGKTVW